jgi:glycosyltransferase involved in cell wall biosynthesis
MNDVDTCIGVPVHNGAKFLTDALDSLGAQDFRNFVLVVIDDGSTDGSDEIIRHYMKGDRRIYYERRTNCQGLIAAWCDVATIAIERFKPKYFAWASDHDLVTKNWLGSLREILERNKEIVLAHAHTEHMDVRGDLMGQSSFPLDTQGKSTMERLIDVTLRTVGAGDAVYGLFRVDALCRCRVFRNEILPDRILVSEINLYGSVAYTDRARRLRRVHSEAESENDHARVDRQLEVLFPVGQKKVAPFISHATVFLRELVEEEPKDNDVQLRLYRIFHALLYFYRHIDKYKAQCLQEIQCSDFDGRLSQYIPFVQDVIYNPGMVSSELFGAVQQDLKKLEDQNKRLKAERVVLEEKLQQRAKRIEQLRSSKAEMKMRFAEKMKRDGELKSVKRQLMQKLKDKISGFVDKDE